LYDRRKQHGGGGRNRRIRKMSKKLWNSPTHEKKRLKVRQKAHKLGGCCNAKKESGNGGVFTTRPT